MAFHGDLVAPPRFQGSSGACSLQLCWSPLRAAAGLCYSRQPVSCNGELSSIGLGYRLYSVRNGVGFSTQSFRHDENVFQGPRQRVRAIASHNEMQGENNCEKSAKEVTIELLEWPRVCEIVASYAGTESAKRILQACTLPSTIYESENILSQTTAAINALSVLGSAVEFGVLKTTQLALCLSYLKKGFVITGQDAVAIAMLVQFSYSLQQDMRVAVQYKKDLLKLMKPVIDLINAMVVQPEVLREISKAIDLDGIVKDSASSELQQARSEENALESRLSELLKGDYGCSTEEVRKINGRLCIMIASDGQKMVPGLLLQSGVGGAVSYVEPISVVSLNDKLVEARASVLRAEHDVLYALSSKLLPFLCNIEHILDGIIRLDVMIARAKYSLTVGGTRPIFTYEEEMEESMSQVGLHNTVGETRSLSRNWNKGILLQLKEAYHPLLLHQHHEDLRKAKAKIRNDETVICKTSIPVPIDIYVKKNTRVVIITGTNTGGKTIAIKTVGLAALMAKSGLYVLAEEPAYIPWFDAVYADIGDAQSLQQSLSTFSGHLRRISAIKAECSSQSLVLLDEVGAGTNPVEGVALGISLLESFSNQGPGGSLITFCTTHHGELKTLKYIDNKFENASVEFDEELLRPTFRLLWGIPGRSNALNIAERLGVPVQIIAAARKLHGEAGAEMNQVIMDLEKSKQEFESNLKKAEQHLEKSKMLYNRLTVAAERLQEHSQLWHNNAVNQVLEAAHTSRSALSSILRMKQKSASTDDGSSPMRICSSVK